MTSAGDRKRRRQAEFLVHQGVPWSLIRGICVINQTVADEVNRVLTQFGQTTTVEVRPTYYY
ncbi:MAG: DarT ssDNA thymidine ADP-ribosyltransferase family protein [Phormidesmis sp.]